MAATFENVVWFKDAELIARLHDTVPLFTGVIPLSGDLADQVSAALDSMPKAIFPGRTDQAD